MNIVKQCYFENRFLTIGFRYYAKLHKSRPPYIHDDYIIFLSGSMDGTQHGAYFLLQNIPGDALSSVYRDQWSESESSHNGLLSVGASQLKTEVKETDIIGNHKFKNKMTLRSNMMSLNEVLIAELLSKN